MVTHSYQRSGAFQPAVHTLPTPPIMPALHATRTGEGGERKDGGEDKHDKGHQGDQDGVDHTHTLPARIKRSGGGLNVQHAPPEVAGRIHGIPQGIGMVIVFIDHPGLSTLGGAFIPPVSRYLFNEATRHLGHH